MQDDNKDLKEYLKTLPLELRQAILSVDYQKRLQEIVKNNKLMIDQAGKLEGETTLVIIGIEPLDKYVENLVKNVGLSRIQAPIVAHDVNELIFKNIRTSLKNINDSIVQEEEYQKSKKENPTQESVLAEIENPETIKGGGETVSFSALNSKGSQVEEYPEFENEQVEIRPNTLPENMPESEITIVQGQTAHTIEPFHQNVSPVQNIVESKMTNTVVVPKQTIVVEEKTKLPEKTISSNDVYRETVV